MKEKAKNFGKFVRLKLTGQIVEVVSVVTTNITIKFKDKNLIMEHHDVLPITAEEQLAYEKSLIRGDAKA